MARRVRTRLRQLRLDMAARLGREVTLQEVHEATKIAISTLSDLEQGKVKGIRFDTIIRLADFYGINDIGELLTLEEIRLALRSALAAHLTERRAENEPTGIAPTISVAHQGV